MAIRQIRGEFEREKRVLLENVVKALSTVDAETRTLWSVSHKCPISKLEDLYLDVVCHRSRVSSKGLSGDVSRLWGNIALEAWLKKFEFFKVENHAVSLSLAPSDVLVECHNHDGSSISLEDLEPSEDWNKCSECRTVNTYGPFKYELLSAATPELVEKWCSFFRHCRVKVPERELENRIKECGSCEYIDCPFAWMSGTSGKEKNRTSFPLPQTALTRFAYFQNINAVLKDLSEVAEKEHWGKDNGFLMSYLKLTFYNQLIRAKGEDGLITAKQFAWFNTGLLTRDALKDVYICFSLSDGRPCRWRYECMTYEGAANGKFEAYRDLDKKMVPKFIPQYRNPSELIWDINLPFRWEENFDHIFFDNISRILKCKAFNDGRCGLEVPSRYLQYKDCDDGIPVELRDNFKKDAFYDEVRKLFNNAILQSKKRIERNYKWVIPVYFPRGRAMSLAFPLSLSRDGVEADPDLVLLCSKQVQGKGAHYDARTILGFWQVFQNARQVCKPYREWLLGADADSCIPLEQRRNNGQIDESRKSQSQDGRLELADHPFPKQRAAMQAQIKQVSSNPLGVQPLQSFGVVKKICCKHKFCLIMSKEGHWIYFSWKDENNAKLCLGEHVRFECCMGEKGYIAKKIARIESNEYGGFAEEGGDSDYYAFDEYMLKRGRGE